MPALLASLILWHAPSLYAGAEFPLPKKGLHPMNADLTAIKNQLIQDFKKFRRSPHDSKMLAHLDQGATDENLAILRKMVVPSNDPGLAGKQVFEAALILSLFGDKAGLEVLENTSKYFQTNSNIEKVHAAAALILLGKTPRLSPMTSYNGQAMSPELFKLIQPLLGPPLDRTQALE